MSVIFGLCVPHDSIVDEASLSLLAGATSRYGIDATELHVQGRIGMGFQPFHTHPRSRLERQPAVHPIGNMLAFDGRLDNHRELAARLGINNEDVADSVLVLEAFARWSEDCFSHLVGDWALALWSPDDRALYLARDHAGTRTLYYSNQNGVIRWSTHLETFFVKDNFPQLDHTYFARVLSSRQVRDVTPYKGIKAIFPAHYTVFREGLETSKPHWRWIADTKISYRSDAEYDEHFLCLFGQAVQRRIGSGDPVIAELSGGMDSTSIVCMADRIFANSNSGFDLVDTLSYYDDTEPDWNERPYFTTVESFRNKAGVHLDCSSQVPGYQPLILPDRFYPYLGGSSTSVKIAKWFERHVGEAKYRVIVSGIGGDELLGGSVTPLPELATYLREGSLFKLYSKAVEWCLADRQTLIRMLRDTFVFTANMYKAPPLNRDSLPPWLSAESRRLCLEHLERTGEPLGATPNAINNGRTWWAVLDTLPHLTPHLLGCYEYRYPYLDRDLVEFLHRVPREQLARPRRRRCLMRRALKDIVPVEIIERKRKAYISRGPIAHLRSSQQEIEDLFTNSLSGRYGLIDPVEFLLAFRAELAGELKWIGPLTNAIKIEVWLRSFEAAEASSRNSGDAQRRNDPLPVTHRATKIHAGKAIG
jgi:asparagine synthase (glutamine-hydrolysing)